MIRVQNLFAEKSGWTGELSETLVEADGVQVKRIGLRAEPDADRCWYDQETDEWVMMARGGAVIEFEEGGLMAMKAGDHVMIPRKKKHRVVLTSRDAVCVTVRLEQLGNVRVGRPSGRELLPEKDSHHAAEDLACLPS